MKTLVKDFVHRTLRDDPELKRDLFNTAEEWFDGADSAMKKFVRNDGVMLPEDFRVLAMEAKIALDELGPALSAKWKPRLQKLRLFATRVAGFVDAAKAVSDAAETFAAAGAYESEACGLVIDAFKRRANVR